MLTRPRVALAPALLLSLLPLPTAPSAAAAATAPASGTAADPASNIGYMSARQLADRCSGNDAASSSTCFAYLAAVTDTVRAYEIWLGSREFCLSAGISQSEIRRAFMTYVSTYPAQSGGQAASVVVNALKTTYPCD